MAGRRGAVPAGGACGKFRRSRRRQRRGRGPCPPAQTPGSPHHSQGPPSRCNDQTKGLVLADRLGRTAAVAAGRGAPKRRRRCAHAQPPPCSPSLPAARWGRRRGQGLPTPPPAKCTSQGRSVTPTAAARCSCERGRTFKPRKKSRKKASMCAPGLQPAPPPPFFFFFRPRPPPTIFLKWAPAPPARPGAAPPHPAPPLKRWWPPPTPTASPWKWTQRALSSCPRPRRRLRPSRPSSQAAAGVTRLPARPRPGRRPRSGRRPSRPSASRAGHPRAGGAPPNSLKVCGEGEGGRERGGESLGLRPQPTEKKRESQKPPPPLTTAPPTQSPSPPCRKASACRPWAMPPPPPARPA